VLRGAPGDYQLRSRRRTNFFRQTDSSDAKPPLVVEAPLEWKVGYLTLDTDCRTRRSTSPAWGLLTRVENSPCPRPAADRCDRSFPDGVSRWWPSREGRRSSPVSSSGTRSSSRRSADEIQRAYLRSEYTTVTALGAFYGSATAPMPSTQGPGLSAMPRPGNSTLFPVVAARALASGADSIPHQAFPRRRDSHPEHPAELGVNATAIATRARQVQPGTDDRSPCGRFRCSLAQCGELLDAILPSESQEPDQNPRTRPGRRSAREFGSHHEADEDVEPARTETPIQ